MSMRTMSQPRFLFCSAFVTILIFEIPTCVLVSTRNWLQHGKVLIWVAYLLTEHEVLAWWFLGVTQYNGQQGPFYPTVTTLCNIMSNAAYGDLPSRFYRVFETVYGGQCIEPDQSDEAAYYQDSDWDSGACSSGGKELTLTRRRSSINNASILQESSGFTKPAPNSATIRLPIQMHSRSEVPSQWRKPSD